MEASCRLSSENLQLIIPYARVAKIILRMFKLLRLSSLRIGMEKEKKMEKIYANVKQLMLDHRFFYWLSLPWKSSLHQFKKIL